VARIKSGTIVSGLTAVAMVIIAVLAAQASGSAPRTPVAAKPSASTSGKAPSSKPKPKTYPLPGRSGSGKRVVYSLSGKRVWLVARGDHVARTYPVIAGNVAPSLGIHRVYSRNPRGTGGDGAQVEHVVLFAETDGLNIGFSAEIHGRLTHPDPSKKTGALRQTRIDGAALWLWATTGSVIDVVR
jgi:hypothetical protein